VAVTPDVKDLASSDLLELWADSLGQRSALMVKASTCKRAKTARGLWAAARGVEEAAEKYKVEVYRRMGVPLIGKTVGLVVYAASRHHKQCDKCHGSGGMNGRFLHWWTKEMDPLPYMQARQGASKKQVMESIQQCALLCNRCAAKKGGRFDKQGKPKF
jgi:mono/diheme cytochrome c family protein